MCVCACVPHARNRAARWLEQRLEQQQQLGSSGGNGSNSSSGNSKGGSGSAGSAQQVRTRACVGVARWLWVRGGSAARLPHSHTHTHTLSHLPALS
jgi:hypothetical protein